MNYYLNVSLIGSSTKNDRCQDVTLITNMLSDNGFIISDPENP